jgi:hypothetical protein
MGKHLEQKIQNKNAMLHKQDDDDNGCYHYGSVKLSMNN